MTMRETELVEREALQRSLGGGPARPTYGYYRQPNGWVKPAVVTDIEELKYRREGWEPLPQYGRFDMGTKYAADHPLELLFINGGAKELSEEQVRQMGLYMHPPVVPTCRQALTQNHKRHSPVCWVGARPVHLPQVEGMTGLGPFVCRFCDRKLATVEGRDQHEQVMHREEKSAIRTGETLAESLTQGLSGAGRPGQEQAATLAAVTQLTKEIAKLKRGTRPRKAKESRSSE